MDAQTILVIILSLALAVFLILAIALAIMLIRISRNVKNITEEAEGIVHNVNSISGLIKQNVKPAIVSASIVNALQKFLRKDKRKGKK